MIVRAAELWGPAETSFLLHARGIEHHSKGVENCMAAINLVVATGRIGREGCGYAMITGQGNGQGGREQGQKCDQLPGARDIENPEHRAHIAGVWGVEESSIPHKGLSAVPLLEAIHEGRIKGLLLLCFNPVVSLPDGGFIREALEKLEFFAVIDFFLSETARYADVVLPGSLMEEDEGTTTNVEGRVIHHRQVVRPPTDAREDWRIICDLAQRLGAGDKFAYQSPREIFDELRVASKGGVADYYGITWDRIDREMGVFWPCPSTRSPGHAAPLRRRAIRPPRRQGALPARRVAPRRRGARRGIPDPADHRTRGVALPVGHADAPHRRARRSVPAAVLRDPPAPRRASSASPTATSSRSKAGAGAIVVRAQVVRTIRPDTVFVPYHWPLDRAANDCTIRAIDPDLEDPRVQDLRGARSPGRRRLRATSTRSNPRPGASGERARVLHRLLALHRLPGVRAGVRGVRHAPRPIADPSRDHRAPRQRPDRAAGVHALRGSDLRAGLSRPTPSSRRPTGVVQSSLKPRCIGCSNCVLACPFGVPKYDARRRSDDEVRHVLRPHEHGQAPMCATVCPSGALAFTTLEEIERTRAGTRRQQWRFGDERVRTKVWVLVPTEVTHINVTLIPVSSLETPAPRRRSR